MKRTDFDRYITAFNERRYPDMITYYHPEVALRLPAAEPTGPDGIRAYYERLHASVEEVLDISWFLSDEQSLAVELSTEFRCHRDLPDFSMRPLVRGDVLRCTNFVHYDLLDGLFRRIRVARYVLHA